jgi:hypothetical protein
VVPAALQLNSTDRLKEVGSMDKPIFPIKLIWKESDQIDQFDSVEDVECNLEHFDSQTGEAIVIDALGRNVHLRVFLLNIEVFEYA